jgi:hypothetical protein
MSNGMYIYIYIVAELFYFLDINIQQMNFKEDDSTMMRKLGSGITQPKEPVYRAPAITISPITDREG